MEDVDPDSAGVCGCVVGYTRWTASGAERDLVGGGVDATERGGGVVFKLEGTSFEGEWNEQTGRPGRYGWFGYRWDMNMVRLLYNQAVLVVRKTMYQLKPNSASGNHHRPTIVMVHGYPSTNTA